MLSNNIPLADREKLAHLYHTGVRNNRLAWFIGGWAAAETVMSVQYFKKMAKGWRLLSLFGLALVNKNVIN